LTEDNRQKDGRMGTRRRGLSKTEFLMMGSHLNMPKF